MMTKLTFCVKNNKMLYFYHFDTNAYYIYIYSNFIILHFRESTPTKFRQTEINDINPFFEKEMFFENL